jgi:hypothetical protein
MSQENVTKEQAEILHKHLAPVSQYVDTLVERMGGL